MKIIKIKKQNILKNNQTIEAQKRNRANNPTSKMINNKRRSVSVAEKNILNETQIKKNISFDNSLELDYLNFSQIDLYKYNQSFEDDMFTPNNNNKKRIVEERYQDSVSTMNDNSTINKNEKCIYNNEEQKLTTNDKNHIMNTPSTICNYYDQSTNKKFNLDNHNEVNDEIKKNLSKYYNKNNENDENYNPNKNKDKINKKDEYAFSINCPNIILNNEKPTTKYLTQNLKSNSILSQNKYSKISNITKINKTKDIKASNSQNKVNNKSQKKYKSN